VAKRGGKRGQKYQTPPRVRGTRPLQTGTRKAPRAISFPFQEGPIPEDYLEAVADLGLFCQNLGLDLPKGAEEKLARYAQRLTEANSVMNLSRGASTPEELVSRHLGDSLIFQACLGEHPRGRLLDVGTGAGLPAIPLAIACPYLKVVALDSRAKKIAFVHALKKELHLDNLTALSERAEVLGHQPEHREGYDVVVSRATANLPVLLELTLPFLKPDGYFFASKGSRVEEEIQAAQHALRELQGEVLSNQSYPTLDPEVSFAMLVIQRTGPMNPEYPRHPSKIKSRPLGQVSV
jgi:16S rRNA (guanine527-N7)-methyltransferase